MKVGVKENTFALDCEFNGHLGELMSVGLYNESEEFYFEIGVLTKLDPWVAENVVPLMSDPSTSNTKNDLRSALSLFLRGRDEVTLVCDWWADVQYITETILSGPGESIPTPPKMHFIVDRNLSSAKSKQLHHALEDAKAIWRDYIKQQSQH